MRCRDRQDRIRLVAGLGVRAFASALLAVADGSYALEGSFSAGPGAVDYRATPITAQIACDEIVRRFVDIRATAISVPHTDEVPAHCRVEGFLPTRIGFQLNLPAAWNGRLYMFGNGGYAGEAHEDPRQQYKRDRAIANGFATARTDTGHLASKEPLGTFAQDQTALVNHAYLAVHETVEHAKAVAAMYYGIAPRYSYWDGCSTGGRQGVMAAQRYPQDLDGILAAAPTLDWTSIMIKGLWWQRSLENSGMTMEKMQTTFRAVMRVCDQLDGIEDGLIDDPRQCKFDPNNHVERCRPGKDGNACLTETQASALAQVYAGPRGPEIPRWVRSFPGFEEASTLTPWVLRLDNQLNLLAVMADSWMKYFAFSDPNYDSRLFKFDRDPPLARKADAIMNPEPDLGAFEGRGGKMITFWGWADTALNPTMGLDFYEKVRSFHTAQRTHEFYRFFLIPGVAHCEGGYGPSTIDAMSPLIDWVEKGIAPERLAARRIIDGHTIYNRAYCAYPAVTLYKGSGDTEDPANYSCKSVAP